jgi:hypothetical protein
MKGMSDTTYLLDESYLERGLIALAKAGKAGRPTAGGYGHIGAAVISAYALARDHGLDSEAQTWLKRCIDRLIARHATWFESDSALGSETTIDRVVDSLARSASSPSQMGHEIIYGTLGLRALVERPDLVRDEVVSGLTSLVTASSGDPPATDEPADDAPSGAHGPRVLARFACTEAGAWEEPAFFVQMVPGHIMTHAQAIISLHRLGLEDVAVTAYPAFARHVTNVRRRRLLPTNGLQRASSAPDPTSDAFWRLVHESDGWRGSHTFKFAYQFTDVLRLLPLELQTSFSRRLAFLLADNNLVKDQEWAAGHRVW